MQKFPTGDQIKIGMKVLVEIKENQGTGKLTEGVIKKKLTSGDSHPHGIKVELESGLVGRVKEIFGQGTSNYEPQLQHQDDVTKIIISKKEDLYNEFKETFQHDSKEEKLRAAGNVDAADARLKAVKQLKKDIQKEVSIAIAAFANKEGGILFVGVDDDSNIIGLERDLKNFDNNVDKLSRSMTESIKNFLQNLPFISNLRISFPEKEGKIICIVQVPPAQEPIYVNDIVKEPYVRLDKRSEKFDTESFVKYCKTRFR